MKSASASLAGPRKATNITIEARLLAAAKMLKINVSHAAEAGLAQAVAARQAELWLEQNQAALESSNSYVEQQGLPLAQFRNF
jgi:antitoxin CcdA